MRDKPDRWCNGGIGADVSRRRKQKTLGFVVSRIEEVFTYKMLRLGLLYVSGAWLLQRSDTVAPTRGLCLDILDIPDIPGGDRRSYASLQPLEGFDVVVVGVDDAGVDF